MWPVILQVQQASTRGISPGVHRQGLSPGPHRSGSSNTLSMQRQPSSSGLLRQPSNSHTSGSHRHPSASGMHRNSSGSALHRQGSSPALMRRSDQSPAAPRGGGAGSSPAVQRPGTASSSGAGMSQRQPSMSNNNGANGILKHGRLAALLRQASSPGMQRQEGSGCAVHRQGGRHGSGPAVQRPEGTATGVRRQGGRDSVPRQGRSPDLQRAESSQRQGQVNRAGAARGNSPALQRLGSLPSPVVAADFGRRSSAGLSAFPSGDLAGRSERVCALLL